MTKDHKNLTLPLSDHTGNYFILGVHRLQLDCLKSKAVTWGNPNISNSFLWNKMKDSCLWNVGSFEVLDMSKKGSYSVYIRSRMDCSCTPDYKPEASVVHRAWKKNGLLQDTHLGNETFHSSERHFKVSSSGVMIWKLKCVPDRVWGGGSPGLRVSPNYQHPHSVAVTASRLYLDFVFFSRNLVISQDRGRDDKVETKYESSGLYGELQSWIASQTGKKNLQLQQDSNIQRQQSEAALWRKIPLWLLRRSLLNVLPSHTSDLLQKYWILDSISGDIEKGWASTLHVQKGQEIWEEL